MKSLDIFGISFTNRYASGPKKTGTMRAAPEQQCSHSLSPPPRPPLLSISPATATHNKVLLRHHPAVNDALDAGLLQGASAYTESVTDWRQNQTKCDLASRTSSLQYQQLPASITSTQPTHPARKSLSFVSASRFLCFYCVLTKQRRSRL